MRRCALDCARQPFIGFVSTLVHESAYVSRTLNEKPAGAAVCPP